jgi:hypothetical protein
MRKMKPLLLLIGGALIMMTSCYKSETVYYDELDVTQTNYEVDFNFSSYSSFAMPDSTILKTNFMTDEEIEDFFAPGGAAEKTKELLKTSFGSRGYTYTDSYDNADFVAVPTVLMMKYSGTVYYPPGWWWGYPGYGWGYPGWGWGWPGYGWGYPGYGYSYQYKLGTIVLEMVDGASFREFLEWQASNPGQGQQSGANEVPDLLIRWMASIDGYITSDQEYNQERAKRGMDEAFEQSPYLKK